MLSAIDQLEAHAKPLLENTSGSSLQTAAAAGTVAHALGIVASDLRDFVESIKPTSKQYIC